MRISPSSTSRPAYANWAEYRAGVQKMFFEPNRSLKFTMKDDLRVHRRGPTGCATLTFRCDGGCNKDKSSHPVGRSRAACEQPKTGVPAGHQPRSGPLAGAM